MRVLIADDDPVSRQMLARMLSSWRYDVIAASDGDEARAILQWDDPPRLVILDWMMPGLTGPELCRQLREDPREAYAYILLLTARSDKHDVIEGMKSGADDYITKPFDTEELKVRLRAGRRILDLEDELVAAREALRDQAMHDPLTGLWNRYSILDMLRRELARAAREERSVGVVMADIDHFKQINDTFGHLAGDAVLQDAARRLEGALRPYDVVGRYGGEEFLIVLPSSNRALVMQQAERLRSAIGTEPVECGGRGVRVTLSLGATTGSGGEERLEDLIQAADQALYLAKGRGRNRVEWAHGSALALPVAR
jgi:two-component system, cell cycle response regulator